MLNYKFKIEIGDPSDDGHGHTSNQMFSCNYPLQMIREKYLESCKITGLTFNSISETGLDLKYSDKEYDDRRIAVEYQDSMISDLALKILSEYNVIDIEKEKENGYYDECDRYYIDGSEHFFKILMKFIKISLPDLEYDFVRDDVPTWSSHMGYGLFH